MNDMIETLHDELADALSGIEDRLWRHQEFVEIANKISVAIGMRRTGKTHLMLSTIKKLQDDGVSSNLIMYIDFEDDRLLPLNQHKLGEMVDAFYSCYPENHDHVSYLFFDEIQNVEGWAKVIRRLLKTKNNKIYLTGSSAKLLSTEIATELRGRSVSTEVWPLSYHEFLLSRMPATPSSLRSKKSKDQLFNILQEYIHIGGFPEVISESEINRNRILQDYIQTVMFRDIVERHDVTNITALRYMIHYLLQNTATNLSTNKLYNDLKSQGFSIGRVTVYDYLSHIEDAYLMFRVPLYSESVRKSQSNPQKIYAIDTGLVDASKLNRLSNKGRYLENLVYLELRRREHQIFYYLTNERFEVDFFTKSLDGQMHLYQVTWDMTDSTVYEREYRALQNAEKELGISGTIITADTFAQWALTEF